LTRTQPPLSLARQRASGEVYEIPVHDLRFSPEETAQFLQTSGASLTSDQIRQVRERLKGWPAGLRLLSLALEHQHTQEEIARYLTHLSGGERTWLDYFVNEILNAQPEAVQHFLLQTSIPERLTGSLCTALTGLEESDQMLAMLEQA